MSKVGWFIFGSIAGALLMVVAYGLRLDRNASHIGATIEDSYLIGYSCGQHDMTPQLCHQLLGEHIKQAQKQVTQ